MTNKTLCTSARRYTVTGTINSVEDARRRIEMYAFQEPLPAYAGVQVGWVHPGNLLDTDFGKHDWSYMPYVLLCMKVQQKKPPAALVKAQVALKVKAWCDEQGRAKCPRAVKEEIKDLVLLELLTSCLPSMKSIPILWNTAENYALLHSHADGDNEQFRKLFQQTFELQVESWKPADLFEDDEDPVVVQKAYEHMAVDHTLENGASVWPEGQVAFKNEEGTQAILAQPGTEEFELCARLYKYQEINLHIEQDEITYDVQVTGDLVIKKIKYQKAVETEEEGFIYERAWLYEHCFDMVCELIAGA